MPLELTVTTSVAGVVLDPAETLSQLGDAVMVNDNGALPVRLIDWLAGFAPPLDPEKVKLAGLGASVGLLETTRDTGIVTGEFVAPALVIDIVAL
jgi:hypothetical protein